MADTYTTNLNLTKPEPGAAEDTWGISLNADLDSLDAIFSSSGTQINLNPNQINFADGKKAIFGTGSDLEIFHDGNNSYIKDLGTGRLFIQSNGNGVNIQSSTGENMIRADINSFAALYYDGGLKINTTATGIDVTGTVTSDGLTVDNSLANPIKIRRTTSGSEQLEISVNDGNVIFDSYQDEAGRYGGFTFQGTENGVGTIKRFEIAHTTGDISFYDDTGTTQGLFWDASTERLGIGTTSPTQPLNVLVPDNSGIQIESAAGHKGYLFFGDEASNTVGRIGYDHATDAMGLWTASAEVVVINSTGIDVTGTVTSDGGLIEGSTGLTIRNDAVGANEPKLVFDNDVFSGANHAQIQTGNGGLQLIIESPSTSTFQNRHKIVLNGGGGDDVTFSLSTDNGTSYKNSFKIDNNDISFYDDTGSTQGLFWDASAESLGIGTTSPSSQLHLAKAGGTLIKLGTSINTSEIEAREVGGGQSLILSSVNSADHLVIDGAGRVGIGTDSPSQMLELSANNGAGAINVLRFNDSDTAVAGGQTTGRIEFAENDGATTTVSAFLEAETVATAGGGIMTFGTGTAGVTASEKMRLDQSGNLLVGTTSTDYNSNVGFQVKPSGQVFATASSTNPALFNRRTTDGDIAIFRKDGTTVGSIGTRAGDLSIGTNDTGINFWDASNNIIPENPSTGAARDDAINLGSSGVRFKDLHLSGTGYFGTSVGIGTTSPSAALSISKQTTALSGTGNTYGLYLYPTSSGAVYVDALTGSTGNTDLTLRSYNNGTYNKLISSSSGGTVTTFQTGGSERMRLDSSGNLLVGTTAQYGQGLSLNANATAYFRKSSDAPLTLRRDTTDGAILNLYKDTTTAGSIGIQEPQDNAPELYIANGTGTNSTGLAFWDYIYPTRRISPCNGAGTYVDNAIDLGYSGARFKDLYLSGGVQLGGTGAANKLDDYEEGVSSVTITPTTSGTVSTPSTNNQFAYTKIGNVVHVSGYLYVSAVSSPIGAFDLSLPFTAADLQDKGGDAPASLWITNINSGANVADFMGVVVEGTNYIRVSLGDGVVANGDSAQQLKPGTQIKVSLTYKVT